MKIINTFTVIKIIFIIFFVFFSSACDGQKNKDNTDPREKINIRKSIVEAPVDIGNVTLDWDRSYDIRIYDHTPITQSIRPKMLLLEKAIEQFGYGYYLIEDINIELLDTNTSGLYRIRSYRLSGKVLSQKITAPVELSVIEGTAISGEVSIIDSYANILVRTDEDARNLYYDWLMKEAVNKYSNAIDVLNITTRQTTGRFGGDVIITGNILVFGDVLINENLPLEDQVNIAMDQLRKNIPQDARVSIGEINTSINKLKNNITWEIRTYLRDKELSIVNSKGDFRITGRIENNNGNRFLHLQLINVKTGNIIDTSTVNI